MRFWAAISVSLPPWQFCARRSGPLRLFGSRRHGVCCGRHGRAVQELVRACGRGPGWQAGRRRSRRLPLARRAAAAGAQAGACCVLRAARERIRAASARRGGSRGHTVRSERALCCCVARFVYAPPTPLPRGSVPPGESLPRVLRVQLARRCAGRPCQRQTLLGAAVARAAPRFAAPAAATRARRTQLSPARRCGTWQTRIRTAFCLPTSSKRRWRSSRSHSRACSCATTTRRCCAPAVCRCLRRRGCAVSRACRPLRRPPPCRRLRPSRPCRTSRPSAGRRSLLMTRGATPPPSPRGTATATGASQAPRSPPSSSRADARTRCAALLAARLSWHALTRVASCCCSRGSR